VTSEASLGILVADLHFPTSRSLKDKRAPLASLRDALQARYHVSFSEVGHQDVWQLARVLVVLAASSLPQASRQLDEVDRYLHGQEFEVSHVLLKSVDPVGALWDCDV
jgi:uncharacterized protein YlxP (DUF503 family)